VRREKWRKEPDRNEESFREESVRTGKKRRQESMWDFRAGLRLCRRVIAEVEQYVDETEV